MVFALIVYLWILLLCYLPGYVLSGLGLYAIGTRRGIEQPWRAWVPGVNLWLLGCLSDPYQAIVVGKQKYKRLYLLGFLLAEILITAALVLLSGSHRRMMFQILSILNCGILLALAVIGYLALYDVYRSCNPRRAELYQVLSIIFPVTAPVFLFLCRKKDLGFPL